MAGAPLIALPLATLAISSIATRVAIGLSFRTGFVAHPDGLHAHARPTPVLGGLAMAVAAAPAVWVAAAADPFWIWFACGWLLLAGVGLLKDRGYRVARRAQLLVQCGAAAVLVAADIAVPLGLPLPLEATATVVLVAAVVNAANFLDVRDGLAASSIGVILLGYAVLFMVVGAAVDSLVAFAFASAAGGFLFHNRPPAAIFMGDCGSFGLGFVAAALAVRAAHTAAVPAGIAVVPLLLPLAELAATVAMRLAARRSPFVGDGRHLSTLLARRGVGPGAMMLLAAATGLVCGAAAVAVAVTSR